MTVYTINDNGKTKSMSRIHCKDENQELQQLLEKNPDLIPGDQINPDDPRRWLLIKREMPVPDPSTGADRWSIDFFFADQDATPTFVECKRFSDSRARRQVVGQMFEYAANGHHYWTKEMLHDFSKESAQKVGLSLEEALMNLQPTVEDSEDGFFERVEQNLREGQLRIVFFMEESPMELRSVVDFLNKQMERSEILLVEAKLYNDGNSKIVIPTLFGYTEEARRVKRPNPVTTTLPRKKWDKISFFEELSNNVDEQAYSTIQKIYEFCETSDCSIKWGTGAISGSFGLVCDSICPRSIISVWTSGAGVALNFGWLRGGDHAESFKEDFRKLLNERMGLAIEENPKFPSIPLSVLSEKVDIFIQVLKELL